MTKDIRIVMTNAKCYDLTGLISNGRAAMPTVSVELDGMSPEARFLAEHITATRIVDEYIDHIDVKAVSSMSMADRDRAKGRSEEYIRKYIDAYGEKYTKPMEECVSFPIYGNRYNSYSELFEDVVRECRYCGAVKFVTNSGESIDL